MELEEGNHKLLIDVGGLSYTLSLLDPSTIRAEPRIPQLELPAKVVMNGADLRRAVKAAEKISATICLWELQATLSLWKQKVIPTRFAWKWAETS